MEEMNPPADPLMINLPPPPNHVQETEMPHSEATPKVGKPYTETTDQVIAVAAVPLSDKRPADDDITIVQMNRVDTKKTEQVIGAVPVLSHKRPAGDAGTSMPHKKHHSEATPKVEKLYPKTTDQAIAAVPLSKKRPDDEDITIVQTSKVDTKTTEQVIAAVPILSHKRPADDAGTSMPEHKKRHHEETTEVEKPNNSTTDEVIAAVPLSFKRPGDEDITIVPGTKRKTSETPEGWICEPRTRKNGVVDKYYRHEVLNVRCRSLKEIERFVKYNIRPGRGGRDKELDFLVEEMKKKPRENVEISSTSEACLIQGGTMKQSIPVEIETTPAHQSKGKHKENVDISSTSKANTVQGVAERQSIPIEIETTPKDQSKGDEILQMPSQGEKSPEPMTTVKHRKSKSLKIVFGKNNIKKPVINESTAAGDSSNKSRINTTGSDQEKMRAKIEVEKLLADAWNNLMHLYDKKGDN